MAVANRWKLLKKIEMSRSLGVFCLLLAVGCRQPLPPVPAGQSSAPGWEVRYDAALALAHRGSEKFLDPVVQDLVKEMLDEEQQLRNFRATLKSGQETSNPLAARMAILGAINAVTDYQTKRPEADLSGFMPALEKLSQSQNVRIAKEAKQLHDAFANTKPSKK